MNFFITDICRIDLTRDLTHEGVRVDVLQTRYAEYQQFDDDLVLPASPGDDRAAALAAVAALTRTGFEGIAEAGGLLSVEEIAVLLDAQRALRISETAGVVRDSRLRDELQPSVLLAVARELGLDPEPDGVAVGQWRGRCLGRSHSLMLSANAEQFGCGWCKVKGGPQELRVLITMRRRAGTTRSSGR